MKTKIITMLLVFTYSFCQSQTIVDLLDLRSKPENNYYLKDINNVLDPFVGTWVYTNGNDSITIVLKKKIGYRRANGIRFEDLLYGGYRYVQNGVEVINTIPQIDDPNITNFFEYSIEGNYFPSHSRFDNDPNVTGNVIKIYMSEPNGTSSTLLMYKTTVNGVEVLQVFKGTLQPNFTKEGDPVPPETVMPIGYLTFIKQ